MVTQMNHRTLNQNDLNKYESRLKTYKNLKGPLMPSLHDAQNTFGCIPIEVQKVISNNLDISIATINGVVTFYGNFSLTPKGKHNICICMGTACYVKGSKNILDTIEKELGIKEGETSSDGEFSITATRCIGACGLAPVFSVGEDIHGSVDVSESKRIIRTLKSRVRKDGSRL
jgi:NADH:ubiquinone oxidoreductase subunit E